MNPGRPTKDRTGMTFGKLTVLGVEDGPGVKLWRCRCSCPDQTEILVLGYNLDSGNTTSCGCGHTKHGMSRTRVYAIWKQMLQRTGNPNDAHYGNYGGRGIKVCERWLKFDNFFADMGWPPHAATLERNNNEGYYEPSNCRWATRKEQLNNKRTSRILSAFGKSQTLHQWAEEYKIHPRTLDNRIFRAGMTVEDALTEPLQREPAKQKSLEVHIDYDVAEYPAQDHILIKAVGCYPHDTGMGYGTRELIWICDSKAEAKRIAEILEGFGLLPTIGPAPYSHRKLPYKDTEGQS